ncbi:hypothetical protein ACFW17_07220 [Streptomyces sp. NPDC058961]|uniref:hypothetical protein n=1 Tax=Streptomyces sp. NPDC058961 TaxID=3346680 RepID=UPI00367AAC7B
MIEPSRLPGDPSELHLRICHDDGLWDTGQADTLERWDVAILHRRRIHERELSGAANSDCSGVDCLLCTTEDATVGSMAFYRIHLDRGRNAFAALEEESEDLSEIAQVVLDPATGYYTEEVSELLEYAGSALLVMDRVTLHEAWRGEGLGSILAGEAIFRLMLGCRAVACAPGISDLGTDIRSSDEWDRVTTKISKGWQHIGFRPYRDNVYLLSPASEDFEERRGALRRRLGELGASWRAGAS